MIKFYLAIVAGILFFLAGLGLGFGLYHPTTKTTPQPDKPAIIVHDSSIVIKTVHDTCTKIKLQPVAGTTVMGTVGLTVVPTSTIKIDTVHHNDTIWITKTINGDTVSITMNILKEKDGSIRVQAKATGGTIVGSVLIPKEYFPVVKPLNNSIVIDGTYDVIPQSVKIGVGYDRGVGPFIIGAKLSDEVGNWKNIGLGAEFGVRF